MSYYDIKGIHCPIDTFIINVTNSILPCISTFLNESEIYCISLLFGFLSSYTINNIKILPGLFFFLSYFFNLLYINYIQKYKKESFIPNNFFNIIIYICILIKLYKKNYYAFVIVFILMVPTISNWGCHIKYIKINYPDSYDIPIFNDMCKILCPFFKENENKHKYKQSIFPTIFGNGSLTLIISIYLVYL
jgi:hypothetical protein